MKSRKILAAVLAPVCAVSAVAVVANAANEAKETVVAEATGSVWEGWNNVGAKYTQFFKKDTLADGAKAGDKVVVSVKLLKSDNENYDAEQTAYKIGLQNGSDKDITGVSYQEITKDGDYEFTLTADNITELDGKVNTQYGTYIQAKGCNIEITGAKLIRAEAAEAPATPDGSATTNTGNTTTTPTGNTTTTPTGNTTTTPTGNTTTTTTGNTATTSTNDPGATNSNATSNTSKVEKQTATVTLPKLTDNGLEGNKLFEAIFGADNKTKVNWTDCESIKFETSDGKSKVSVQFSTVEGKIKEDPKATWFEMGKHTLAKADDDKKFAASWTLGADEFAAFDTSKDNKGYVKAVTDNKDGADVKVSITFKEGVNVTMPNADDTSKDDQEGTGIALAVAPVVLAGAAVAAVAIAKKKH